jgi:hypothetical protein
MENLIIFEPRLEMYVPDQLKISKSEYEERKTNCKKCEEDFINKLNRNRFNFGNHIHFDLYYWTYPESSSNWYSHLSEENGLCKKFECEPKDLLSVAKNIGMVHIIELATYHSVWLHYFYHQMERGNNSNHMEEWDSMYQPNHVQAKNELHFLINLLLTCPDRKSMMEEIREFSLCPPNFENGVCGHEYKELKSNFVKYQNM